MRYCGLKAPSLWSFVLEAPGSYRSGPATDQERPGKPPGPEQDRQAPSVRLGVPPPQPHCPPSIPKSTPADAPPIAPSLLLVSTAPQAQELPVTRLRNLGPFLPPNPHYTTLLPSEKSPESAPSTQNPATCRQCVAAGPAQAPPSVLGHPLPNSVATSQWPTCPSSALTLQGPLIQSKSQSVFEAPRPCAACSLPPRGSFSACPFAFLPWLQSHLVLRPPLISKFKCDGKRESPHRCKAPSGSPWSDTAVAGAAETVTWGPRRGGREGARRPVWGDRSNVRSEEFSLDWVMTVEAGTGPIAAEF